MKLDVNMVRSMVRSFTVFPLYLVRELSQFYERDKHANLYNQVENSDHYKTEHERV